MAATTWSTRALVVVLTRQPSRPLISFMNIVILAAGQGKRMRSNLPKVLHCLAGKPLLAHVIDTARTLKPGRICVVYGHGGEQVPTAMRTDDLIFVRQAKQLGTGHALKQALPYLDPRAATLVLYGDVPLTTVATLRRLTAGRPRRAAAPGSRTRSVIAKRPAWCHRDVPAVRRRQIHVAGKPRIVDHCAIEASAAEGRAEGGAGGDFRRDHCGWHRESHPGGLARCFCGTDD